jgi:adenylate cyclase
VSVPASVQSVILSRVDRLDARSRHVLQLASVIGRVFPQRVVARLLADQADLAGVLWELEERALVYQERAIPEVEYSFKHVLTREAVYHNLPRRRRQALHRQVAQAIEALYPDGQEQSESLAYHYDRGSDVKRAVIYLMQAGEKAKRGYANAEALAHLNRRLELVRSMPESPERDRLELDTLTAMGVPLVLTKGHAAQEVGETYTRADELSERLGDDGQRFHALMGLRRYYGLHAEMAIVQGYAEQLLALAQRTRDPDQLSRAHMMLGDALSFRGAFSRARQHCEQGLAVCDPERWRTHVFLYGNDTGVGCRIVLALVLWYLGYPDQAAELTEELLALAHERGHPFTRVFALHYSAVVRQSRGEAKIVRQLNTAALHIAQEHGFPLYIALATAMDGWALAVQGQVHAGIEKMLAGIAARRATGAAALMAGLLLYLVRVYALADQWHKAVEPLDEAQRLVSSSGESNMETELSRLRGELLLAGGEHANSEQARGEHANGKDAALAEICFQHALDVARDQQARSLELRAATSLARLWGQQGRVSDARALLGEIYGWFTEGFDTADLIEAKALLDTL